MSTDARWETLEARSELTSQMLSEPGYLPEQRLRTIQTRVRAFRHATPAITTEYHMRFVNIAFLLRLVTRNGRPVATSRTPNFSQRISGMD